MIAKVRYIVHCIDSDAIEFTRLQVMMNHPYHRPVRNCYTSLCCAHRKVSAVQNSHVEIRDAPPTDGLVSFMILHVGKASFDFSLTRLFCYT